MRARLSLPVLVALLALPLAHAQAAGPDVVLEIQDALPPTAAADGVLLDSWEAGERYAWTLNLTADYTTFEVRVEGAFDLDRPRQAVPTLHIDPADPTCVENPGACDYTLFYEYPDERVWEVAGPARIFHVGGEPDSFILRLGVPGPVNATLALTRDVTPPAFSILPMENLTYRDFYQETRTEELALADLQVRKVGADGWVRNPTPEFHYRQRFPIQGLDAQTDYEARVVFTDWAGNNVTTQPYAFRTPAEPDRPEPVVTPLSPEPNATIPASAVVIRARIESPDSVVTGDGVRVFLDKKEIHEGFRYTPGEIVFEPGALAPGRHTVSVEAMNMAGGRSYAQWSFEVEGARESPPVAPALAVLAAGALAVAMRARRR